MPGFTDQDAGKEGIKTHVGPDIVNNLSNLQLALQRLLLVEFVAAQPAAVRRRACSPLFAAQRSLQYGKDHPPGNQAQRRS